MSPTSARRSTIHIDLKAMGLFLASLMVSRRDDDVNSFSSTDKLVPRFNFSCVVQPCSCVKFEFSSQNGYSNLHPESGMDFIFDGFASSRAQLLLYDCSDQPLGPILQLGLCSVVRCWAIDSITWCKNDMAIPLRKGSLIK